MSELSPEDVIDRYISAYNSFDVLGMLATLTPDVRFEHYVGDERTSESVGWDDFRRLAEHAVTLFTEREQHITEVKFEERTATAHIEYRARLAVDLPDGPLAGDIIELRGTTNFTFHDGRISRIVDRS
ncbi:nuclear transport factor 2 family protein [Prescottella equi]|uniref:nuclear transport factor 2 family protein n=1 Tax=Rhodococcus hoagii TaxID=43767 RepID=UPI0007CD8898|nr:nuclear transport factor 2 family protein [Prescottella equi]